MKKESKNNQVLYIITVILSAFSLITAWIPYVNLIGVLSSLMAVILIISILIKSKGKGWKKYSVSLLISILAIVITVTVQMSVHYVHQITLQKSSAQLKSKAFKIGQSITIETDQYRVNSVSFLNQIANYSPNPGNKIIAISLTIKNTATKDFGTGDADLPYATNMFHIQSGNSDIPLITGKNLPNEIPAQGKIDIKDSITGTLYAEVPANSHPKLVYGRSQNQASTNDRIPSFSVSLT
ncbi:DUF4352 domain-containing protein [Fructobacillus americanaquae]|uniref:DUF4352 domain-containing protein n=1 Tax=Fructobacillus americanaquae TaxID=2940302 RepID=A0ABY5C2D4_9LACO|nr:DUF4352 domain-containing protein [Fructobacillus americanaquae]USS91465.1 DUF4352 domain-containing protein [Fructobacillus americanaquae]